jgi:hypothetical protein
MPQLVLNAHLVESTNRALVQLVHQEKWNSIPRTYVFFAQKVNIIL